MVRLLCLKTRCQDSEVEVKIRELKQGEEDLLKDFLYEAIFIPEGMDAPSRDIIELPELRIYYEDFGSGHADYCLFATVEKDATGNDRSASKATAGNDSPTPKVSMGKVGIVPRPYEKVVGAVWTRLMKDYGYVDDETPSFAISLYKEYRGKGYGAELMRAMLELLRSKGFKKASLAVQKANYAVRMYEKVGFVTVDQNDEEFIMTCDL